MTKSTFIFGMAALACAALPAFAASPWDGTWKLNEAKSHMTGTTFALSKDGSMYVMHEGSITFKYACDGKDYPVIADRTITCTMQGPTVITTAKAAGKTLSSTRHDVSADGKTMTDLTTGTRPDGTAFTDHDTFMRIAGSGTTMLGTWKDVKSGSTAPGVMILKLNGDVLHSDDPGYKSTVDTKLDGTPAALHGPTIPPGLMMSSKSEGNDKVVSTVTYNGKELSKDIMTISPDGKTLTDVSWNPGKESEKQTYFYEKE
jgi:hypothetical protein